MTMCETQKRFDQDSILLMRANGDSRVFDYIYQTYKPMVYRYLASISGRHFASNEDMVQEVFLRAWRNRRQFRGDSTVKTYLLGIARRVLLEEYSQALKNPKDQYDWLLEVNLLSKEHSSRSLSSPEQTKLLHLLENAFAKLSRRQQLILLLYYFEGKSVKEAARLLDCSAEAVKSCLSRGRRKLRQMQV